MECWVWLVMSWATIFMRGLRRAWRLSRQLITETSLIGQLGLLLWVWLGIQGIVKDSAKHNPAARH
jgi:hypothetical protein